MANTGIAPEGKKIDTPIAEKKSVPTVKISLDFSVEKVVELDKLGYKLAFDSSVEGFLTLPEEVVRELDYDNRVAYGVASHLHSSNLNERDSPGPTPGLEILGETAVSASRRLELIGGDPNMHYAWRRPDELDEIARLGYKPATKEEVTSYGKRMAGFDHVIAAFGRVELILFKIPQKLFDANEAKHGELSRERIGASKAETTEKLAQLGGKVLDPDTDREIERRAQWNN